MKGLFKAPDVKPVAPSDSLASEGVGVAVLQEEPYHQGAVYYPSEQVNENYPVPIPRHSAAAALDIPEQSMYERVGKPDIHGRPHRRQAWTINEATLHIDGWPPETGYIGKWIYTNELAVARGLQTALADGANIEVPRSVPAGSLSEVPGHSMVDLSSLYVT